MKDQYFLLINTSLIVSCLTMALIFILIPLPKNTGLKNYKISLRFLAGAYIALAILTVLDIFQQGNNTLLSVNLTAISLQTILFSLALITLFKSEFSNLKLVVKLTTPTLIFIVLYMLSDLIFPTLSIVTIDDYFKNLKHPTSILNIIFLTFCIGQFGYYSKIIMRESRNYKIKIDDYYADNYKLKLKWVNFYFYCACLFCMMIILSIFIGSYKFNLLLTCVNVVFYLAFGLTYIQYPKTFEKIEPAISITEEKITTRTRKNWSDLKRKIEEEKYYLKTGINIEDMSFYLKIGRTSLSTFINNEENLNFNSWVNKMRIEEAKKIMVEKPDLNLIRISEMVGYTELSNFSKHFKIITSETPSNWKLKNCIKN